MPAAGNKDFCSPMWSVRQVDTRGDANVELVATHMVCPRPYIKGSKTDESTFVDIPCLVNFVDIGEGSEIIWYKPTVATAPREKRYVLAVGGPSKRPKV